jgi:hypothetical protein
MESVIHIINGLTALKFLDLKRRAMFGYPHREADYVLKPMDPYFAGLIDTDGSVFNYPSNRIECI